MLKQLRLKFICFTMTLVTAMLCVIFGLVLHFTAQSLEAQSIRAMEAVSAAPMQVIRPGIDRTEIHLPYFVIQINNWGRVLVRGSESFDLSDTDYLQELLAEAESAGTSMGILKDRGLRFLHTSNPAGETFVFADISSERGAVSGLANNCLWIGALAFLIFLGLSILLARAAVRPVERAWTQQRQFVADASHELKTPLTIITTNAELLQDSQNPDTERCAESIVTTARRMRGLVEGLLDLARIDSGMKTNFSPLSFSQLLSDAVLPFEPLYYEAGLTLQWRIDPAITVRGSQSHLQQLPEILLDNAMKYSHTGTIVFLGLQRQGSHCLLTVSNSGDPISKQDLKNIFKRFYRVDQARSGESYGLGLSIAENVAHSHGGKIWATSENGRNTFYVQLPAAAED